MGTVGDREPIFIPDSIDIYRILTIIRRRHLHLGNLSGRGGSGDAGSRSLGPRALARPWCK